MQGAEEDNQAKSRSDEESIRPSPNYNHKKYLSSKFEESKKKEKNSMTSPGSSELQGASDMSYNKKATVVQPPLPPNPPPPDTIPIINLKQEIEDDEYQCNSTVNLSSDLKPKIEPIQCEEKKETELQMCRNFARGSCKKGASCIFAHEIILKQLPGVYTFCRNFQNSVCTYPKCKFVHATVFEKESYFRTGYLPPHTIRHLKEGVTQPPPPPPSEVIPQMYPNAPNAPYVAPHESSSHVNPVVALSCTAPPVVARTDFNVTRTGQSPNRSPKRDWSEHSEFCCSPRDLDFSEPLAKKCKSCANNEFRVLYFRKKIDSTVRQCEDLKNKGTEVSQKTHKLHVVTMCLAPKPHVKADDTKPLSQFAKIIAKLLKTQASECPDSPVALPDHKFKMGFM